MHFLSQKEDINLTLVFVTPFLLADGVLFPFALLLIISNTHKTRRQIQRATQYYEFVPNVWYNQFIGQVF